MGFVSRTMQAEDAIAIASWTYETPYDFYNMGASEESVNELLNGCYRVVAASNGQVVGFYCVGISAQVPAGQKPGAYQGDGAGVIDLGIGMHPDLTGRGLGSSFLAYVLRELIEYNPSVDFRLTVAMFNNRAIKLYRRFGFQREVEFERNGVVFQTMKRLNSPFVWLRRATGADEQYLCEWLRDPVDCTRTIGHAPLRHEDFVSWVDAEDQALWILDSASGPVGYGEVWIDEEAEDVELAHLVVAPERRGQGLGRVLVSLLSEQASDTGFPITYMRVNPDNEPALACYRAAGFERMTEIPDDWPRAYVWMNSHTSMKK